jgi:hypothetical protein
MSVSRRLFVSAGALALTLMAPASRVGRADEPVGSSVRYNREIVRIFERKCIACHSESGGIAIPLASYSDVKPWARAIREEILERRMPPWPAARGVRPYANELSLTTREIVIVTSWVDGGTPRGEPSDLPPARTSVEWPAGEPTLKVTLPGQPVKLDDTVRVTRVTVPAAAATERWLRGFDIVPGARNGLRSVSLFVKMADGTERWLGGWTPWHAMKATPGDVAHRIPANAILTAEMHYKGWDERQTTVTDRSVVGLYFQPSRPARPLQEAKVTASAAVPSGTRRRMRGEVVLTEDAVLWAMLPRLDAGGAAVKGSIEVSATKPDGGVEPLSWVKDYNPDWQSPYVLREPLLLPRGSRVVVTAYAATDAAARVSLLWYGAAGNAAPTGATLLDKLRSLPR